MPPQIAEMWLPSILFGLFTLLSIVGAYLVTAYQWGRRAGIVAAVLTALFFAALLAGLLTLIHQGGLV